MKQLLFIPFFLLISFSTYAQELHDDSVKQKLNTSFTHIYRETLLRPGRVSVDSIALDERKRNIELHTNLSLSYLPMRDETVLQIYDSTRFYLPEKYKKYRIAVFSDREEISNLVPNFYRDKQIDKNRLIAHKVKTPLITRASDPAGNATKGMQNNHSGTLAKFMGGTTSEVRSLGMATGTHFPNRGGPLHAELRGSLPMLENAGANVLLPHAKRDYNREGVDCRQRLPIKPVTYHELTGKEPWNTSLSRFRTP